MFNDGNTQNPSSGKDKDTPANTAGGDTGAGRSTSGGNGVPSISLPKGGGAVKGIGEKFAANPVTGTGSMTVPVATSPGRSGFGPQLSLSYDSGAGNGPFGFGWSLSLPAITRKTDKGLPRYWDGEESDVFILSGSEDLVPVLVEANGEWQRETLPTRILDGENYRVQRYRPRIEGLFARIERWTNLQKGETHWRSITRDNVTTLYGKDDNSRVFAPAGADPENLKRVFNWLICQSYDDKGNVVVYEYALENDQNVDLAQANERNRSRNANRYIKRVKYGNTVSRLVQPDISQLDWMFEVVFDYEEGHYEDIPLDLTLTEAEQHRFVLASSAGGARWADRPDPFSVYRSGFEVRTYRRCKRILMFHNFAELAAEPYLVRSTEFDYFDFDYSSPSTIEDQLAHQGSTRFASFARSITQSGFVRDNRPLVVRNGVEYATYLKKSLPPLEFEYSKAQIQQDVRELDESSLENLPVGLDGSSYQWVDLDGEGISGILTDQADAWFYKHNLGGGHFGPLETIPEKPSLANLSSGQQLIDLAGDGQLDLVTFGGPSPGFYERTQNESWENFRAFSYLPNLRWDDPNLRFVDLTGDGHADILITQDEVLTWYPSLSEDGFDGAGYVRKPFDEERGPRLVLADGTQSIYLADMCGDGLTALVRIRNGEVCYWPNLGYGRFGAKVTMDDAPWFDHTEQFENKRIRLADIDGSGTNDIIYLAHDGVRVYFNQSGNRWSGPRYLSNFPHLDNLSSVMTLDLLGNGTACLVWSSPLASDSRRPLRYIDLMGGQKPHLLVKTVNNFGAETVVHYNSSTRFYLQDKAAGKPWITKLPFPVHVVDRVETYDRISGNRFVTRYDYHHGYFDGIEREFRGFGMVEQRDTEEFAALSATQGFPVGTNIEETSHIPPVLTRTWFHTGVFIGRNHISDFFAGMLNQNDAGEYYREPGQTDAQAKELLLDDTVLPAGLTIEEEREACRALKGSMLRQEIYALDGTPKETHPYSVTEQNFTVKLLQPQGENRHAVYLTHAQESLSYTYERDPSDPRVAHTLTLEVDNFGNVTKSASINYGRRQTIRVPDGFGGTVETPNPGLAELSLPDQNIQTTILISYRENSFTNAVADDDNYRTPSPSEAATFELAGLVLSLGRSRFSLTEIFNAGTGAVSIAYEQTPNPAVQQRRLIELVRTLYRPNNLTASLFLGQQESLGLTFETYKLSFTPGLVTTAYGGRVTDPMLTEGGYVHSSDLNWWVPSGQVFYSPNPGSAAQELLHAQTHFFLPHRYRDPFHTNLVSTETVVTYDVHDLLTQETRDPMDNRVTAGERDALGNLTLVGNDYRVLQPRLVMDPNRNRNAVAFDALGMVVGTAVMGKPEQGNLVGDRLAAFTADLTQVQIDQFVANPKGPLSAALLGNATTRAIYDLTCYLREPLPNLKPPAFSATLVRETHSSDPVPLGGLRIQVSFSYSDGFSREIQKKVQAEAGPVPQRDINGKVIVGPNGLPVFTVGDVTPRWVGSGWTIFNNKGKAVRQYEPFFTDTARFEFDVRIGVSPILFYDPVERVVTTLHPEHTWEKVVFDPWRQETWDPNDTVLVVDPGSDPSVGDFFSRLPTTEYLPTWHTRRQGGALGAQEQTAANKTSIQAATPTVAYFDSLGRTFLTVSHNKFKYSDSPPANPPLEELYLTRVSLDIEGNQRRLMDAKDRVVMRYDYDMLSNRIHQSSMEAGQRWLLNDVAGKPLYSIDSRDHQFRTSYDSVRRAIGSFMREGIGVPLMVGRNIYGETQPNPEVDNLRGRIIQILDQAGSVLNDQYDFKSNLLRTRRQLATEYKATLDWSVAVPLDAETYTRHTRYDALNRPVEITQPDNSLIHLGYNDANLLDHVETNLRGPLVAAVFVDNINYDSKGQRTLIVYGNGAKTTYEYDPLTFRLVHLLTERDAVVFPDDCPGPPPAGWPGCQVQNLRYTYDPIGNITHIRDDAQQTRFFNNRRVEPSAEYTYDAIYRLIEATGREHLGQVAAQPSPGSYNDKPRVGILMSASDGNAVGRYIERFFYDEAGNFDEVVHRGSDPVSPGWTRSYAYNEASQLEPAKQSNRLTSTTIGATTETYSVAGNGYDPHGNLLRMPQLQIIQWDFKDQLQMTQRQAVNVSDVEGVQNQGERTWHVYDSGGQRVRKVTEVAPDQIKDQRIYLGGFESYRRQGVNPLVRETLHIMDDKQRVALVETRTQGNEPGVPSPLIRYQFGNHLGSASLELDRQAQIISYEEYYPYGSTSFQAVRSQTETSKRYRFTGKERDEESGLYYHGARYYVPWLGRWLNTDPLGIKDGLNVYAYSRDNPIRFSDPSGTECNERDSSTCPQGTAPPPPVTTGTLLPSADANGGGPPRDPPPPELPGRGRTPYQLTGDFIDAVGDSSSQFQLRGGLLSPQYRATTYPVVGTDQIGPSLGRAFRLVWDEHPQLQADVKQFGLGVWHSHTAPILLGAGFGAIGVAAAAGAGDQWAPASRVVGLATLIPEQTFDLASRPANPGDLFFRQGAFSFRDSPAGRNEGENAFGLFPTLQLRGQYLDRDVTVTAGVNARFLPDLRQFRVQESFGLDYNLARFNIGAYRASFGAEGRLNTYQQIDVLPEARSTSLPAEGSFMFQFRITEPPARRGRSAPSFVDRPEP